MITFPPHTHSSGARDQALALLLLTQLRRADTAAVLQKLAAHVAGQDRGASLGGADYSALAVSPSPMVRDSSLNCMSCVSLRKPLVGHEVVCVPPNPLNSFAVQVYRPSLAAPLGT